MTFRTATLATVTAALLCGPAIASDIRVAPVTIETLPGVRTTSITIINEEDHPVRIQIRVMRWTQRDGEDVLSETRDVVASPPLAKLEPGQHYLLRLVRTAKAPPSGEEAYRVIVDEIPDPANVRPGAVNLVLRQEIPAFFSDEARRVSVVDWSITQDKGQVWLTADNRGNRRLRLSDLQIEDHGGVIFQQAGLVGYVQAGQRMRWPVKITPQIARDPSLQLRAMSDTGRIEVPLVDLPAR